MAWRVRAWTLVGLLLAVTTVSAMAQIVTTTVTDTIYRADGTTATGTVLVNWQAFTTALGQSVPSGSTSAAIASGGTMTIALVPNAGATPMGSYYTAVYHLDDGTVSREFWVVPASQTAVEVSAIKNTVLPTSVAMQTVSKSYVDTAIATAVAGHPLDSSNPYVLKAGDTMTGPLNLSADPVTTMQAADKQYVDTSIAGVAGGLGQKVSLSPAGSQIVTQPGGTNLEVNKLNGEMYASQYVTVTGNNGISNALASPDCAGGCDINADPSYSLTESYVPSTWNSSINGGTHVEDRRAGEKRDSYFNPVNILGSGLDAGVVMEVDSTRSAASVFQRSKAQEPSSYGMILTHRGLTGGQNLYPQSIENTPYFKSTYGALSVLGYYNTMGQHGLVPKKIECYGVGDCLIGSEFIVASGGFRDDADEGAHPMDLQVQEDSRVFQGTCSSGCTTGSTTVMLAVTSALGTQGEGRYLIDKNPADLMATGSIISGTPTVAGVPGATVTFSGTSFPVSVFFETAQTIPSQASNIAPGTVTVALATTGVVTGFATNTAAAPSQSGVACVVDQPNGANPQNYEMANYTVVDGTHLQMTLLKVHRAGATIAMGGLCGYGLEETVDTVNGIRQVFPVIGSYSPTGLYYYGSSTAIVGINGQTGGYLNLNASIASIVRSSNVVTVTTAGSLPVDVNGLTLTVSGVTDSSYNGSYAVTTTAANTLTYANTGANSTSSGGTVGILTGGYVLYPMAEVLGVYDAATKTIDGQLTLAPNTVPWAASDPLEEPHYYQEKIAADTTYVTQTTPRATISQTAGIEFDSSAGPGLSGWLIRNAVPATNYLGNGGTHSIPLAAYISKGIWQTTLDAQAGENSVFAIHCNSHGCGKWNSAYDLFELDSLTSVDRINFQPTTSALTINLRGTIYGFTPQSFTAGTINATTVNATKLNGAISAAQLPIFGGSGSTHAAGAVPDPGATAGTTRYLREDGTWATVSGTTTGVAGQLSTNLLARYALTDGSGSPQDSSGNGNNATLPGGTLNPAWTTQGITCNGSSQYFNSAGTQSAKTFVWVSTQTPQTTGAGPVGPQFVTPFGVSDRSVFFGGNEWYGNQPAVVVNGGQAGSLSNGTLLGTHVFALTLGTNTTTDPTQFYIDGAAVSSATAMGAAAAKATGAYQVCGTPTGAATYFPGSFYYFEAYSDEKTAAQVAQESNAVKQAVQSRGVAFAPVPDQTTKDLYLSIGDSLTNGHGVTPSSSFLTPTDSFDVVSYGLGGALTTDLAYMFDARDAALYRRNAGRNVIRLWVGTNDFTVSRTPQQALEGIRSYCRKAKAVGFQTIVSDMISRTGEDSDMLALDALMTTQDTGCDLVIDLASDARLGAVGASANATYFQNDDIHLTQAGQQNIVAPAETRAINLLTHLKSSEISPTATAAAYTMADYDLYLPVGPAANSVAVTLPDCGYFTGLTHSIKNVQATGANTVTVAPAAGELVDGSASPLTIANGATLVVRSVVLNRTTGGCSWLKVSNN
ncbi:MULTISPECIES: SGNH/GDSL hydrolase family protein [Acidobacteriaceae]|uniref:SGNH/GDSL hydrolase family protein n=1 Tax=Acidobacteriaceae TaxID=204434 RepID=UPI00131BF436|nr:MULTISPECIES: SGNH/GDSL hydrolase family protein [Acidobacteriaceae]MDW5265706.1 SGNH/GDSL hydrolase family protein [Edaphobacter sp.]